MEKYPLSVAHIPRGGAEWDMRDGERVFVNVQTWTMGNDFILQLASCKYFLYYHSELQAYLSVNI